MARSGVLRAEVSAEQPLRVGVVQLCSGVDTRANWGHLAPLVDQAVADGARLVVTPECSNIVQRDGEALRAAVTRAEIDPVFAGLAGKARDHGVWVVAGSLLVDGRDHDRDAGRDGDNMGAGQIGGERASKISNRGFVFGPDGTVRGWYDKLHLFDVTVSDTERYFESDTMAPGDRAVVVETPWCGLGLSICYDVRFGHLYRDLAKAGAGVMVVPAAFTRNTGRAHWEVLLRARAIETGAYVVAAGQGGVHEDGRATWGHSMVVDPWGEIVASLDHDRPGVMCVDLALSKVAKARGKIPALMHDRAYTVCQGPSSGQMTSLSQIPSSDQDVRDD